MRIALIDTGVLKEESDNMCKVRHYSLSSGVLVEEYAEPSNNHGTDCYKEIVSNTQNQELQILDFNIIDETGNLRVPNIVAAINKSIEEKADLINISLGLTAYSQELYDVCEEALLNNIVVLSAASHTNTVSFPADFNNVICVKVDQKQTEKIKTTDHMTVSISMKDFIIKERETEFDFSSSSLACARLCGYFCDDFSTMPLCNKYKVLANRYNIHPYTSDDTSFRCHSKEHNIYDILAKKRVAVVLYPMSALSILDKDHVHENVIAYFDHEKCDFINIRNGRPTKEFDTIIVLNSRYIDLEVPEAIKKKYPNYEIIRLGNFLSEDDNDYLYYYNEYESSEMAVLEKPVIAITGLCSGLNKLDIQLSLFKDLQNDGLAIESVSNNPMGVLYNTNVFNYPKELTFPNIVYSINKFMFSCEVTTEMDAWLINIGGALSEINNLNTYNFGKLADAYFSAVNIDVVIVCVNPSIDVSYLEYQLAHLYKHGIEKIFIVLSHNDIDASTVNYKDGLQTYYVDNTKYLDSCEYLQKNIEEKIFTLDDVKNGNLYRSIIEALS